MAVDAILNMNIALAQKTTIDNYYNTLKETGYLKESSTEQVLFATLLLDTLAQFKEFITDEFTNDVNRILTELNCCNCLVTWDGECGCSSSTPDKKYDFVAKKLPGYYLSSSKTECCCCVYGDADYYVVGDENEALVDFPKSLFVGAIIRVTGVNDAAPEYPEEKYCVATSSEEFISDDYGSSILEIETSIYGLSGNLVWKTGHLYRITGFTPMLNNSDCGAILYEEVE